MTELETSREICISGTKLEGNITQEGYEALRSYKLQKVVVHRKYTQIVKSHLKLVDSDVCFTECMQRETEMQCVQRETVMYALLNVYREEQRCYVYREHIFY